MMSRLCSTDLSRHLLQPRLKRSRTEEELYDVTFVRLQPIELDRRNRPQVQRWPARDPVSRSG